jgi:hypothetical protein
LILLEGSDLTGKTTLARHIEGGYGLTYFHLGPPDVECLAHHLRFVAAWEAAPLGLVMDRGHWSGLAYGRAGYNPGNELGEDGFALVDRVMDRLGAVAVYCHGTPDEILSRWDRGEDYLDREKVGEIVDAMDWCETNTILPKIRYRLSAQPLALESVAHAAVSAASEYGVK